MRRGHAALRLCSFQTRALQIVAGVHVLVPTPCQTLADSSGAACMCKYMQVVAVYAQKPWLARIRACCAKDSHSYRLVAQTVPCLHTFQRVFCVLQKLVCQEEEEALALCLLIFVIDACKF